MGWIWPKDPRPGNPEHWPTRWRIFDVLTNKGPDIYVGKLRTRRHRNSGSTRPTAHWSGWESGNSKPERRPFPWAQRDDRERYDYRTRRYQIPDGGTWSKVEYFDDTRKSRGHEVECMPRTFSDPDGHRFFTKELHDGFYGGHEDPRLGAIRQEDVWRHEDTTRHQYQWRHEHPWHADLRDLRHHEEQRRHELPEDQFRFVRPLSDAHPRRHENTRKQEIASKSHEHPKKQEVSPKVQEKKKTGFFQGWW